MEGFILDVNSFKNLHNNIIQDLSAPLETVTTDNGEVKFPEVLPDYSGNWFYCNNELWFISKSEPEEGITTLSLQNKIMAFDRDIIVPVKDYANPTYGGIIYDYLISEFVNQQDPNYAMPYITVTNTDETSFDLKDTNDDYLIYTLAELMQSALSAGIAIDFEIQNGSLTISIYKKDFVIKNVVFDDGYTQLESETYSHDIVTKIVVSKLDGENKLDKDYEYYYLSNGRMASSQELVPLKGKKTRAIVRYDADPAEEAWKELRNNTLSHKIEFYSYRRFHLWDNLALILNGEIFYTKVSYVGFKSDDDRYHYKCGQLMTTIVDSLSDNMAEMMPEKYVTEYFNTSASTRFVTKDQKFFLAQEGSTND